MIVSDAVLIRHDRIRYKEPVDQIKRLRKKIIESLKKPAERIDAQAPEVKTDGDV